MHNISWHRLENTTAYPAEREASSEDTNGARHIGKNPRSLRALWMCDLCHQGRQEAAAERCAYCALETALSLLRVCACVLMHCQLCADVQQAPCAGAGSWVLSIRRQGLCNDLHKSSSMSVYLAQVSMAYRVQAQHFYAGFKWLTLHGSTCRCPFEKHMPQTLTHTPQTKQPKD